jgi:hypothetical protein
VRRRPRPPRVVLWGGRPGDEDQLGAARNWRRAFIARAAATRDQAIAAGDLDAARQHAVQGRVVAAAEKSADQGGLGVLVLSADHGGDPVGLVRRMGEDVAPRVRDALGSPRAS